MSEMAEPEERGLGFRAVLLRTPIGVFLLGIFGSIPAAALTVGVGNWGDLGQRLPWWVAGVFLVLLLALVLLGVTVHPVARRLAAWSLGWMLVSVSSLFAFAIAYTIVFNASAAENTAASAVSLVVMMGFAAVGGLLIRRRVRDASDARIERSVLLAKDLLIPDDDRTDEILASLSNLRSEVRDLRAERFSGGSRREWCGPDWAERFCVRRGWLREPPR